MPSIGKYVSASNSSLPVNGRLSPRPGRWNQRASRAFITNQPALAGTSPAPVSLSSASGTIVRSLRAVDSVRRHELVPARSRALTRQAQHRGVARPARHPAAQWAPAPAEGARESVRLQRRAEVPLHVGHGRPHGRHPHVVHDDQPARPHQAGHEVEVEEDALEAVIAVHEGEVELAALRHEPGQRELALLLDYLDELVHPRLPQGPEPRAVPRLRLEGIDRHVTPAAGQYGLAQEERRHAEREADLDGPLRRLGDREIAKRLALSPLDAVRGELDRGSTVV